MKKLLIVFSALFLFSCSEQEKIPDIASATTTENLVKKCDIIFDVPALLNKNVDEVVKILGKPEKMDGPTKAQENAGVIEWEWQYEKNGQTMLVTFNFKTRMITDFFLDAMTPEGCTDNVDDLKCIANVFNNATPCRVEPVPTIKDPKKFTGIKISKK